MTDEHYAPSIEEDICLCGGRTPLPDRWKKWPTSYLTVIGFAYVDGTLPVDSVVNQLLSGCPNPQLRYRLHDTIRHILRGNPAWRFRHSSRLKAR